MFLFLCIASPSGPPLDVAIISRDKKWLILSWKLPEQRFRNGKILHNLVCRSTKSADTSPACINSVRLSRGIYHLLNLRPATKYFVTVAAGTSAGYGVKSAEISGITNGGKPGRTTLKVTRMCFQLDQNFMSYYLLPRSQGTRHLGSFVRM